jgi:hypothetical protein
MEDHRMASGERRRGVLLPRAETFRGTSRDRITGPGLADLQGKKVAFIDDSRPNADVILAEYRALMEARYGIEAVPVDKRALGSGVNQPLPEDVFERLVREVDAAVVALGS